MGLANYAAHKFLITATAILVLLTHSVSLPHANKTIANHVITTLVMRFVMEQVVTIMHSAQLETALMNNASLAII
jgi:hypothetical protein